MEERCHHLGFSGLRQVWAGWRPPGGTGGRQIWLQLFPGPIQVKRCVLGLNSEGPCWDIAIQFFLPGFIPEFTNTPCSTLHLTLEDSGAGGVQLHSRDPALGWRLCEDPQLPALSFQSWETAEEGCSVGAGVARQKELPPPRPL